MLDTVAALIACEKATVKAKVRITGKMETSILAGHTLRPLTLRYATIKKQQFYQRKKAKTNQVVALKALSSKLAKACYHVMAKGVPFDEDKLFA